MNTKTTHRLLVVDDSRTDRKYLCAMLEKEGHSALGVEHAHEALDLLQKESFDLVLLDLILGEDNGIDVCRKIRTRFSPTELPIVIVTSLAAGQALESCLEAGANDFVSKPVERTVLKARINSHLRLLQRTRELFKTQQHLAQKQRMQAVGLLAAALAHNMNNALGVILGSATLLEHWVTAGSREEAVLKRIIEAVQRSSTLLAGLSVFNSENGVQPCDNPEVIVRQTVEMVTALANSSIKIEADIKSPLAPIAMNSADLTTVLIQLLENSIEAISETGNILVSAETIEPDLLTFRVIDSGGGFNEAYVERAFDPFFSTKSAHTGGENIMASDGSGLGLYLVQQLLNQVGGKIQIEQTSTLGTTVRFDVPRCQHA